MINRKQTRQPMLAHTDMQENENTKKFAKVGPYRRGLSAMTHAAGRYSLRKRKLHVFT